MKRFLLALVVVWSGRLFATELERYNVIWDVPGKSSADSMPLGNGELGINLWVEENGDLLFYLSRNDTHSEVGQLCKAGKVRVSLSPNPFKTGAPFRQELKLRDGVCEIVAGDAHLKVFVDAEQPVVHVLGESVAPLAVTARVESWRTQKQRPHDQTTWWTLQGAPGELWQAPDVFPPAKPDAVSWYHRNEEATAFESTIKVQSLESIRSALRDPLLHRTFGGWVTGSGFRSADNRTLVSKAPMTSFDLRIASPCAQTPTAGDWLSMAEEAAGKSSDSEAALARTLSWWHAFWERSWVDCGITPGEPVPTNAAPLRIGPGTAGTQPSLSVGAVTLIGRPLSQTEIRVHAAEAPKTGLLPKLDVPDFGDGMTMEAWIKLEGTRGAFSILEKRTGNSLDGFRLGTHGTRAMACVGRYELYAPHADLLPGKWHHIAATYDPRTAIIAIYQNGELAGRAGAEGMTVGKAYSLQRYMQACAGRGLYPIKFNGSIFTVEPTPMGRDENPDYRRWGEAYWWQNTRIPIHSMLGAGDFETMMPLFNLYEAIRPMSEARAKLYYKAAGCYFPETVTAWGAYGNADYGWKRDGLQPGDVACKWWRYASNQGPELVSLMLDYYDYTQDRKFLAERLLPMAVSVLKYYDTRFRKDERGRIVVDPAQVLETYWQDVVNDTPTVAGLNAVTSRLCALPQDVLNAEQRSLFEHMKAAAPEIPMEDAKLNGKDVRRIRVAQKFNPKRTNGENGDIYAIWPYRLFGMGKPMLDEARATYWLRAARGATGWAYDQNAAALLGLTGEAAANVKTRIANSNGLYRWPATWGPNADWLPDHCHGGNLMYTINAMLLQEAGDKILVLPAWPREWDVSFKLHAPRRTTVEAVVRGGKVTQLKVTPESRLRDVILNPEFQQ